MADDPIPGVGQLPDATPFVLLPLRLETRYLPGRFCVRVFPDDVLVDTFQPRIAEAELANVTAYWVRRWLAGGDPDAHRAAWAALVRAGGAGRARWLTVQVAPLDPDAEPDGRGLVIVPATSVPAAERDPIARFWTRVWSTAGAERDAARADLAAALGAERAARVEAELAPVNLADTGLRAEVAFLDLPARDTLPLTRRAWSRGARAWLLPQRLVLLGFRGGEQVLQRVGEPIPAVLPVGPDPAAAPDEQLRAGGPDLAVPDALRWTVDFEAAVRAGMAFAVELDPAEPPPTFDRLFVLGVRLGGDAERGGDELSTLVRHHQAGRGGLALLPQGRPTSNTDDTNAGHSWWEDPDESFAHFFEPHDDRDGWRRRTDGAWLARLLGVDRSVLRESPGYYGADQAQARAMHTALWPATLGYYLEQLLEPVVDDATVRRTREFFTRFVLGRGTAPAIRAGRQPYGILPATVWSAAGWWHDESYAARADGLPGPGYLDGLAGLLRRAGALWRPLTGGVAHLGAPGPDPHRTLLDIVGLHPGSVEFHQRYARSFTHYANTLWFSRTDVGEPLGAAVRASVRAGLRTLADLGWDMPEDGELPEILEKVFLRHSNLLTGPLVQDPVSDTGPLAVTRPDGRNYVAWLRAAAGTSHDTLRRQEGFPGGVPTALLYQLLRHALDLGYVDTALELRRDALDLSAAAVRAERREPKYIQVAGSADAAGGTSRWRSLYRPERQVTGDPDLRLGDYIPRILQTRQPYLHRQLEALDELAAASSGALERALAEHLDCLTYRLDAWQLGLQAVQLEHMRDTAGGAHIGAYGWLEHVRPKETVPSPVALDDDLAALFADAQGRPLLHDPGNAGHLHAHSLDQAVTAAVLRGGHHGGTVDLGSARVRAALRLIEGIGAGQSLGALLGYRLERLLHDEPALYLDGLIYELRRAFPLAGNRNTTTRVDPAPPIGAVEARNVVDGAALAEHLADTGATSYPYGLDLPPLEDFVRAGTPDAAGIGRIVDARVATVCGLAGAVADLQLAEGVYQVVRGNYDRAAAVLDAYSKGGPPTVPEVVTTRRRGRTLTHRVGLHLPGGLPPGDPAVTGPRAAAEPALAGWLAAQLPPLDTVYARITWAGGTLTPSVADLGLTAADLFYLADGLDDRIVDFAERAAGPPHGAVFGVEYGPDGVAGFTVADVLPLVQALRGMILGARPLQPADLGSTVEGAAVARTDTAEAVRAGLAATLPAVDALLVRLDAAVAEDADAWTADYAAAVRPAAPYGLASAHLTAAVEGRRAPLAAMVRALDRILERWGRKRDEYDATIQAYGALPSGATDEERTALLVRAGRTIATTIVAPLPAVPELETRIAALRDAFDAALAGLTAVRDGADRVGATFAAFAAAVPAYTAVDHTPLDLGPFRDALAGLALELRRRAEALRDEIVRRTAGPADAQVVLGAGFVVLPEFTPPAEFDEAWSHRADLVPPLALDDWLTGVARVRERLRCFEAVSLLGEALGVAEPAGLEAVQVPYRAGEPWLGLEFAGTVGEDKLLYTAHYGTIAPTVCGLLLDEWVEVVPEPDLTTGLAFHFDRPGSAAPQAILLVTPPRFTGGWRWADLVATLHETLDLAVQRAVEPAGLDRTALGPLLPAVVSAVTLFPITAALNFAVSNDVHLRLAEGDA
ncbi:hypothetical protein [Dactylosporangium sp. CS-033363]|uniref:hypothetical protein n=1 Tax=Dactylosporangium sp. CS-033363 TaxID=3239935 RepID=UPI003D924CD8